ncbi:MAG: HNH endonuclease [Dysgonamonadaceae bacterium]|jgi:hypothetical protein|nr:HNH endonuclease [Dysgonamonadaceae bacterium]
MKLLYIDLFCGAGGTSTGVESAGHNEIWKPIKGFEIYYEVSNYGNVRRKKSKRVRKVDYATIYPTVLLSVNGLHKTLRVHRLVAMAFLPMTDENKTHVNHIDGNKRNNHVRNLEWVTQAENNLHSYRVLKRKGSLTGKIPSNRKVNNQDIPRMDRLNKSGISTDKIGKMYGIKTRGRIPVNMLTKNGKFIRQFDSATEAADFLKINNGKTNINACCLGKKKSAYGYKWQKAIDANTLENNPYK